LFHGACKTKLYLTRLSGSADANANANADAATTACLSTDGSPSCAQGHDDYANAYAYACASCRKASSHRYSPSFFLSANHIPCAAAAAEASEDLRLFEYRICARIVHFARNYYPQLYKMLMHWNPPILWYAKGGNFFELTALLLEFPGKTR
jgi:hypothetical protein